MEEEAAAGECGVLCGGSGVAAAVAHSLTHYRRAQAQRIIRGRARATQYECGERACESGGLHRE
jgi:hypothetical protein